MRKLWLSIAVLLGSCGILKARGIEFSGGAGGSNKTTIALTSGGDVYIGSQTFVAVDGAVWTSDRATFYITSIIPFAVNASSVADTVYSVRITTEVGTTNVASSYLHSSSFTVPVNQRFGTAVVPDNIGVIPPRSQIALWTTVVPTSGTLPGGYYGVLITGTRVLP